MNGPAHFSAPSIRDHCSTILWDLDQRCKSTHGLIALLQAAAPLDEVLAPCPDHGWITSDAGAAAIILVHSGRSPCTRARGAREPWGIGENFAALLMSSGFIRAHAIAWIELGALPDDVGVTDLDMLPDRSLEDSLRSGLSVADATWHLLNGWSIER
jgi:hypothetical protein